jgi:dephospho-CoA kinase
MTRGPGAKTIVLGLTGSVGMGKSLVAGMLRDLGVPVHDADAAVHALLRKGGRAVAAVGALFPEALMRGPGAMKDDQIDRAALGRIVFADPGKMKKLEGILHPLVRADSDAFIALMRMEERPLCVLDIPLLFETKGEGRVDKIACVTAPPEIQRARALARPGMTAEKFERILASQMPDAEKRARSRYIIDNGGSREDTLRQVKALVAGLIRA